jgi:hypothetical protein
MAELDVDRDGKLEIDEFAALLSCGDHVTFRNEASRGAFLQIRRARRLDAADFLKSFKNMPAAFGPSFIGERWRARDLLPSSVFKAQIDLQTMLWKDVLPVKTEELPPDLRAPGKQPHLRSTTTSLGAGIQLVQAQGVPLPTSAGQGGKDKAYSDDHILKRVVRVAIQTSGHGHGHKGKSGKEGRKHQPKLVHNTLQIPARWRKGAEDVWEFDGEKVQSLLRSFVFRTTHKDDLDKGNNHERLLFELVVYVKQGRKQGPPTEMSCGWCELHLSDLVKGGTQKLALQGGSPLNEEEICSQDVRTGRSGVKSLQKFAQMVTGGSVESRLEVKIEPYAKLKPDEKFHMDMLPSTCLLPKALLYFASGFMNYKAQVLLKEASSGAFRKPPGDAVLASFPKILDCPDILEDFTVAWAEDHQPTIDKGKRVIDTIVTNTKDAVSRIYPLLHSEAFGPHETASLDSAVGDQELLERRKELVLSAMRYGSPHVKGKGGYRNPHELTAFRPFTIQELEYEVWDTARATNENHLAALA